MKHPTLFHRDKNGTIWSCAIWTEGADVVFEHGLVDGKKQTQRYTAQPTNVGKSNERNGEQQAEFEAEAKWKFKLERKYALTPEAAEQFVLFPMLAENVDAKKKHLFADKAMMKFIPCDIQPKLDGVRCMAIKSDGKVVLTSRQGKEWKFVPHIVNQLTWLPDNLCLDGELYIHGEKVGFQTITSWCKGKDKAPHPESPKIEYHVYDCIEDFEADELPNWENRAKKLATLPESSNMKIVPTFRCNAFADIRKYQAQFVEEGYEGAIVRILKGDYEFGHRSSSLLKVKSFSDAEYPIVGFTTGKEGSREGEAVIWICMDAKTDATFQVRPQGTHEDRKQLLLAADQFVGQQLKVKFFELTDDGLPRFPVGIAVRAEED